MKRNLIILFFAFYAIIPSPAMAADYYVAADGSDSDPGTLSQPFATIQYGVNQLAGGDILYIRGGRYHESVTMNGLDGGSQLAWLSGDGWQDAWSLSGDTQLLTYSNNQSVCLRKTGEITRTLANGITDGTLSFKWDVDSLDNSDEKAIVEIYDGSWHTVWELNNTGNGSDTNYQADNLQTANNISLNAYGQVTQVRFRIAASGTADYFFVDDVSISGTGGSASHDFEPSEILITNYQNEQVLMDGTKDISVIAAGGWTVHSGDIYKIQLNQDIWQLFVDDEMMTSARWPDSEAWTGAMWDKDTNWMQQNITSSDGIFVDESGGQDLAGTGTDFTGAIAIMNVGSWLSFARTVTAHSAESDTFTYSPIGAQYHWNISSGSAFFEAAYACLSTNREWYFNHASDELFLITDDGLSPAGRDIRGKTITYGLDIQNSQNIIVRGIDFFACTFKVDNSDRIVVEHCDALFSSYSKRMLASTAKAEPTTVDGNNNTLRNCTFRYADGTGIIFAGDAGLIENCLFYQIDYSCVGTLHDVMVNIREASNLTFRHNTLDTGGNSVGIKGGPSSIFEFNRVTNQGMLQHDGSAIQTDADYTDGTIMQNNWVHDHIKYALRFDSPWLDPAVYGVNGIMRYNVLWNTRPMVPKGDYHHIYGNTGFDNDVVDISIFSDITHGGINTSTVTRNNAVNVISGGRSTVEPYPGTADYNWVGVEFDPDRDVRTQLVDPDQWDFRPATGSDLIDAGLDVPAHVTSFIGSAPDIGAYEYGDTNYWIPGFQDAKATIPIPSNGATNQPLDRELIYLIGYQGANADIYFGTDYTAVLNATTASPEHMVTLADPQNIYTPGTLSGSITYYWRVDTVLADQSVVTGDVWNFTTETGPVATPVLTGPANGTVGLAGPVTLEWIDGIEADHHDLYISKNSTLVSSLDASVRITDVASGYAAIDLDGLSEYFWCVAAVNVAAAENTPSAVWSFTTAYNIVTSNFGSAADNSVTAADLDAVTTGPASWAINGSFVFNEFILDAGTDAGYYVDTRDIAPTIGDNVALTMDSALDFTLSEKTVAFDLTHARTAEAGLKILTVEGLDSSNNRVFAITVDCSGLAVTPFYWDGSALQSYTGVTLDRGPQAGAAYDHSLMTTFQITLDGTDVTYVADGQTVTGTTTSTDFKILKFKFDTVSTYSGFWVDNILVYGLAGDSTPPAAPAGLIAAAGNASVSLDWADNGEPDLASYTVYRTTTSGSGYASIAAEVADSDYADDTAANCTTYYYVVKAVDTNSNESAYGNEDSATPYISLLDLSGDCEVDLEDLVMLSAGWQSQYSLTDLHALAEDWLDGK